MHISEGILDGPVLAAGAVAAICGVAYGLRRLDYDDIPEAAVLAAVFFVASLVKVPFGAADAHLTLSGLLGLLFGWAAFPIIFVGLALQALLFQFGGLTTLGINTVTMALPAVAAHYAFSQVVRSERQGLAMAGGALGAALAVLLSAVIWFFVLKAGGKNGALDGVAYFFVAAHIPILAVEAAVTAFAVRFLRQVNPELLRVRTIEAAE